MANTPCRDGQHTVLRFSPRHGGLKHVKRHGYFSLLLKAKPKLRFFPNKQIYLAFFFELKEEKPIFAGEIIKEQALPSGQ